MCNNILKYMYMCVFFFIMYIIFKYMKVNGNKEILVDYIL